MELSRAVNRDVGHAEQVRLDEDATRAQNWKRWGPYLSERQWGTVREDYSEYGNCWEYFPHDQARSRAYRWGEDGLLGITDRECRLCFALALWNGEDPILKERLFGLTNNEGNHGEDVKEYYFYLDSTPTHSYTKALYKYPQTEYPYTRLIEENRRRGRAHPEYELLDTGIFAEGRYFDLTAEYAKVSPDDLLIRITVANRGPDSAPLDLLPTLWFRNTWAWGRNADSYWPRPAIDLRPDGSLLAEHVTLGRFVCTASGTPTPLFTDNETNTARLFGVANTHTYVKDAFHAYIVGGEQQAVNPAHTGTKAAFHYHLEVPAGGEITIELRLRPEAEATTDPFGAGFDALFQERLLEADAFYADRIGAVSDGVRSISRQAYAGLLWSKQFYEYIVSDWLDGDPAGPPVYRANPRNPAWRNVYSRDVLSMPDKWEYPWFAAWDLAFHLIVLARIDGQFAKDQLLLLLREWYMLPNGQLPAYEFNFSDVNPPVHAGAAWRVYKINAPGNQRDRLFLERVFQKLLLNFTWWVNRKDIEGKNIFGGGFLGLDNIGIFDRSQPPPGGALLEQADGTAWMGYYCTTMLAIALELAAEDPAYEDIASKFFEHFITISDAINSVGGKGLWDEEDGFYYDELASNGTTTSLKVRSLVGLVSILAVEVLEEDVLQRLKGFSKRLQWFIDHRSDLDENIAKTRPNSAGPVRLLALVSPTRLRRILRYMLDENEFLSPFGIRSLSRYHKDHPITCPSGDGQLEVHYTPGESDSGVFGGNSNWRGPIWMPSNFLLIEALERYHHFLGDEFTVECPTGSGRFLTLKGVAQELSRRLLSLFQPDETGRCPWQGNDAIFTEDPHWQNLTLFYEHFHGDTGRGLGASHQTGWTALIALLIHKLLGTGS